MNTADPLPKSVERQLAERAADGDNDAVGELYDAYERRLFGYCARMLGNPDDAADATQEAFCNVIQRLPGLDTSKLNFGAYLFTAARNASLDILKSQGRFQSTDEVPEDPFAVAPVESDPERALLTGDQMRAAREANERLPEKQRAALALREVAELSYDDIGAALEMNQNAVAQLISRARLNFGKQLRAGAVVVAPEGEDAKRALELTSARIDGKIAADDSAWLTAFLATDESSRINAEAMEESALLYRGIGAIAVVAGLRETVLQKASEIQRGEGGAESPDEDTLVQGPTTDPETLVQRALAKAAGSEGAAATADAERKRRRQRVIYPIAAALILLLILAVAAIGEGDPEPASEAAGGTPPTAATSSEKPQTEARSGSKKSDPRSSQSQSKSSPGLASGDGGTPNPRNSKKGSGNNDKATSDSPADPDTPTTSDPATPPSTPPAEEPADPPSPGGGGGIPSGPGDICAQPPCTPPPPVP